MIRAGLIALVLLAGCTSIAPRPTDRDLDAISRAYERNGANAFPHETPAPADACGAVANHARIGTPLSAWTPTPAGARIIHPGQPVTDDLRRERLNVLVDAEGRITALECY